MRDDAADDPGVNEVSDRNTGSSAGSTPRSRARPLVVPLLASLVMLATACGNGDEPAASGADETTDPGDPQYGGSATYGLEAETSGGWCLPEAQLAISGLQVAKSIYDTLTAPNADGEFVPFLAESIEPNGDFTQWTITLPEGVVFHDGSPLTPQVVKNNLDAFTGAYPTRTPLLTRFVLEPIESVEVVDDSTVQVTTSIPWPALPAALYSGGQAGVMAQAQLDDTETCDRNLIGTGPFMLEEWVPNDQLTAVRNPDYWRSDEDGNQLPFLDRVVFRPIVDASARSNAVAAGDVDLAHSAAATVGELWEADAESGTIALVRSEECPEVRYSLLNTSKPPFDNRDARLAAAHAIDRDRFNEVRYNGSVEMASGPFGPGSIGHLDDTGYPDFDLEQSARHAAAYEEATGEQLSFTYVYGADSENSQDVQLLQSMWDEADIDVQVQGVEQAALISTVIGGDFDAVLWRRHGGCEPDTNYVQWQTDSRLNLARIRDPEISALLDTGRTSGDPQERRAAYQQINERFGSEAYGLWQEWVTWNVATGPEVRGVLGPRMPDGSEPSEELSGGHPLSGVWISS